MTLERKKKWYKEKRGHEDALVRYGYDTDKSAASRHRALNKAIKRYGTDTVSKMLQAQANLRGKRKGVKTDGTVFARDARWVRKKG